MAAQAKTPEQVRRLEEDVEVLQRQKIARRRPAGGLGPRSLALSESTGELLVNFFQLALNDDGQIFATAINSNDQLVLYEFDPPPPAVPPVRSRKP